MHERRRNVLVGLTAVVGLAGFAFLLVLFGYLPQWAQEGYLITMSFADAGGLASGSRVKLSGIDVGVVEEVRLQPPPAQGVLVRARIQDDVVVPQGVRAVIVAPPLGGTPAIALDVSRVPAAQRVQRIGADTVIPGESGGMFNELAARIEQTLERPIDDFAQLQQNFASLTEDLQELSDEWTHVGRNVNQLMAPRSLEEVDAGEAQPSLATVVARLDTTLRETREVVAGLDRWINDAQLREDVRTTAANARELSDKLSAGVDKVSGLAESAQGNLDRLTKRYTAVADDLSREIARAGELLEAARAGEGTIGKLVNDPQLYNNLTDTAQRMDRAITDLRLLLQKWKAEGLPVRF